MSGFRNPFKQHHSFKRAAISKTTEREFERQVRKLEQLDEDTKKISKDTKRCIDCQAAQTKTENKLVQNLYNSPLAQENRQLQFITDHWLQCTQQLDLMSQEMNATSSKTLAEPMKKFSTIFPSLQQSTKKRDQALQELNKCQAKADKYSDRDRTGPNIVKMDASKKALAAAKAEFESLNAQLMEDMPKLYEGRIDYFQPSFQAIIKSQLKYYTEAHKIYATLTSSIGPQSESEMSNPFSDDDDQQDKPEDNKIQQKLSEIRALSITVDD